MRGLVRRPRLDAPVQEFRSGSGRFTSMPSTLWNRVRYRQAQWLVSPSPVGFTTGMEFGHLAVTSQRGYEGPKAGSEYPHPSGRGIASGRGYALSALTGLPIVSPPANVRGPSRDRRCHSTDVADLSDQPDMLPTNSLAGKTCSAALTSVQEAELRLIPQPH
jgi:hypothetical protein